MGEQKVVVFRIGKELLGLPIDRVEKILPEQTITRIPRSPKMFLGVFDLRGATLPAVALGERLQLTPSSETTNYIVVQTEAGRLAVQVDAVEGIHPISDDQMEPRSDLLSDRDDAIVTGVGKLGERLMVLINADEIVPESVRKRLAANSALQLAA
ncbi:MAG TPA: chemotaxis protein CheW [Fimbriimonadaceae bacterium]|nr:chemotaxis protein CheW [Fimbriimonadaceae bacterium]HRJ32503.1 chemotaxis protein CheW [Fimbriimonadaceae bacterium]